MMYVVYYKDDNHKQHMTFVKSFKDVKFIQERFGFVTYETTQTFIVRKEDENDEW